MSNKAADILAAEQEDHRLGSLLVQALRVVRERGLDPPYRIELTVIFSGDSSFTMALEREENAAHIPPMKATPSLYVPRGDIPAEELLPAEGGPQ